MGLFATNRVFELLAGSITDYAIFLLDSTGRVVTWPPAAERMKGYRADEIIHQHVSRFYPPEDIAAGKPARAIAVASATGRFEEEGWRLRKDRTRFWALVTITALRDEAGTIQGFAKLTRDATERKRAQVEQQVHTEALARSNAALESFASVASHDVQEPLRKIQTFVNLTLTKFGDALPDEGHDYLCRAENAASRLQTLIDALLSYSRLAAQGASFRSVDLNQIAREVVSDLEVRISETAASVEVGALATIDADPTQMRQLLQNLIGNALKFHRPETPPIISIAALHLENGARIEMTVADNGIGFEQKYAERIFGVFQRLHRRAQFDGAGIGLAICRRIVERHNGTIRAVGSVGNGARFVVTLPVHPATGG